MEEKTEVCKALISLGAPIAVGIMVQTCYHLVNAFWVGRLGAEALGVISLAYPINLIIVSLASGLALGGTILVAQRHGAGDHESVSQLAAQSLSGMCLLAALISTVGWHFSDSIPALLGATLETTQEQAVSYLKVTFAGSIFAFFSMSFQYTLRGIGEARAPLFVIFPSVIVNAILDPILIFGVWHIPAMGVTGAALATVITQCLTALAGVWLMYRPRYGMQFSVAGLVPACATQWKLLRLGLPASVEQSVGALAVSVMTMLATSYGPYALASYGIMFRIMSFTLIPAVGISMATSILLGQKIGAGDLSSGRRVSAQACWLNVVMMLAVAALLIVAAHPVASLFAPNDPELADYCATVIRIVAFSYPLAGLQNALNGSFRGSGATVTAMVFSLLGVWAFQIPIALLLSRFTPLADAGLWWSMAVAGVIQCLLMGAYYKSGRWLPASTQ